jgi:hypothetical protein
MCVFVIRIVLIFSGVCLYTYVYCFVVILFCVIFIVLSVLVYDYYHRVKAQLQ